MYTIAWDIDDTLNNLLFEWLHFYNKENLKSFNYNNLKYPLHECINCTKDKLIDSFDSFKVKEYTGMLPNTFVYDWFKECGYKFNHVVITASPLTTIHISAYWVLKHFGDWVRSFNFVPSNRKYTGTLEYEKTKAEFLEKFKSVDYFIDDNEENCREVFQLGIKTFCVKQPWNNGVPIEHILKELMR